MVKDYHMVCCCQHGKVAFKPAPWVMRYFWKRLTQTSVWFCFTIWRHYFPRTSTRCSNSTPDHRIFMNFHVSFCNDFMAQQKSRCPWQLFCPLKSDKALLSVPLLHTLTAIEAPFVLKIQLLWFMIFSGLWLEMILQGQQLHFAFSLIVFGTPSCRSLASDFRLAEPSAGEQNFARKATEALWVRLAVVVFQVKLLLPNVLLWISSIKWKALL